MKIEKIIENNILKISIEGRLDTSNVSELEKEVENLEGIKEIIFDAQGS